MIRDLLTKTQIAKELNVDVMTINRWVVEGYLTQVIVWKKYPTFRLKAKPMFLLQEAQMVKLSKNIL